MQPPQNGKKNNVVKTFEDLECWKACRQLRLLVSKNIVPILPQHERFRLGDQLIRAARSTTANIAEGYGRFHYLDNAKSCSVARGSCWEVLDHLATGHDEGMITPELLATAREQAGKAIALLNGYMNYLKRAADPSADKDAKPNHVSRRYQSADA